MSRNKLQGYEEVYINEELYIFKGNFSFLATLKEISEIDPISISESVNILDPISVRNVLIASLCKKGSIDADDLSIESQYKIIEEMITDYGLQECGILAQYLLSHAMLGDIKKNALDKHQNINSLLNNLVLSRSKIFKNHAFLWAYLLVIFGIYQCMTIKFLGALIVSN